MYTLKLRFYRNMKSLTMQELAERAGVSVRTVFLAEHNVRMPSPKTRRKFAEVLGVEPEQLLHYEPVQAVLAGSGLFPGIQFK